MKLKPQSSEKSIDGDEEGIKYVLPVLFTVIVIPLSVSCGFGNTILVHPSIGILVAVGVGVLVGVTLGPEFFV